MRKRIAAKVIYQCQQEHGPAYRGTTLDRAVDKLMHGLDSWRYKGKKPRPPQPWDPPPPRLPPVKIRLVVAREGAVRPARGP